MSEQTYPRTIAIVGRPNVGKSALFNRVVGRRLAIVHEQSGVTRDRLSCEARWDDDIFELIDTGGVGLIDGEQAPDRIEEGTRRQVDVAIEDASVVILVVDISAGILPLDREVARLLHESGTPVFMAANKADHKDLDAAADEFEELGFPVFSVSAMHNRGIDSLMLAAIQRLPAASLEEAREPLRIAIVGRPNAGKSSYINRLLRNDRVIVSEVPGTTRDSIEVPFVVGHGDLARHYQLIDTAGMRKKSKVHSAVEKFSIMRAEKSIERSDIVVIMMDAVEGPKRQNKRIAGLAMDHNKGCLIVVNKWDLSGEITQRAYGAAMRDALPFLTFVPIVFVSAKSGYNIRRSIDAIDYVASQVRAKLPTGTLNRVIRDAVQRVQPPVVDRKRLKIFYTVQVRTQPVTIRLFVNGPRRVTAAYRAYLVNSLRQAFGLEGAPVVLQFRERPRQ